MSDGPHRSLNMRAGWRKVAEYADKRVFTPEEVKGVVAAAYGDDWRADVPGAVAAGVCDILGGQQDNLFRDEKVLQLEALRRLAAGHGLGQVVIDCAWRQAVTGKSGPNAAVETVADALAVWGARHSRQVEEHCCRKSTERRARYVRTRIADAIGSATLRQLARQFLKLDTAPMPRAPAKQTGIDDGVRL